jgi:alpha-glucosidase
MELGALQPFLRNHSNQGTCRREPWVHGAAELARRRAAVERRYRLLPFLYTLFEEASRTGLPVMRPLWLEHPADPSTLREERAYLLGQDLLVAPRLSEGDGPYPVVLPAGGWWDADTGERLEGGQVEARPPPGEGLKLYARAGAIVPEGSAQRAVEAPRGVLALHVWPGPDCRGALYLDAGEGFGHQAGELRRIRFACEEGPAGITITAASEGSFPTWWSAAELVVHGAPGVPAAASEAGGAALQTRYDPARRTATALLPGGAADFSVTLRW